MITLSQACAAARAVGERHMREHGRSELSDVDRAVGNRAGRRFLLLVPEPGWKLMRRTFGGRALGHVYVYRETLPASPVAAPAAPQAPAVAPPRPRS